MNKPKKSGKRGEETKDRLLDAALSVFAERGFEGASTRQIATLAGENQGLITYHFGNKEALWKATVNRLFGRLRAEFEARLEVLRDADAYTRIRLLIFFFVRYGARYPEQMQIMVQEGRTDDDPRVRWLVENHIAPLYEMLGMLIEDAQQQGLVPVFAKIHLYYIMIGATSLIFTHPRECELLSGRSPLEEEMIEAHAEAVCTMLLPARPPGLSTERTSA